MTDTEPTPEPTADLLEASPETAYFWGRVAADGDLTDEAVTVRASDEQAADALAALTGVDDVDHSQTARTSAHDSSIVRYDEEYELTVVGAPADRASAALGLPQSGTPGGYRFGAFSEQYSQLLRGMLEACGTICFRESSGSVGISFVHDDEQFLDTVRSLLDEIEPHVPTEDLEESSSGGYWFSVADDADIDEFAAWLYAGSEQSGLYAADRRQKLRRSVERATDKETGELSA
ncbi:cobalamin biosynthesis protein [Halovenus sp. HT40]|uniref:cobalamin biosynthesis protein n=1 Tax=Halovenus sp. HT40 TaxID=3126691 RepID=UPI00300F58FF